MAMNKSHEEEVLFVPYAATKIENERKKNKVCIQGNYQGFSLPYKLQKGPIKFGILLSWEKNIFSRLN